MYSELWQDPGSIQCEEDRPMWGGLFSLTCVVHVNQQHWGRRWEGRSSLLGGCGKDTEIFCCKIRWSRVGSWPLGCPKGDRNCEHPRHSRSLLTKLTKNNVGSQGGCLVKIVCMVFYSTSLPCFWGQRSQGPRGTACWSKSLKNSACHKPFFRFFFFLLLRAEPTAYGNSQARGQIRAVAAGLCHGHSNSGSKPHLWPTPLLLGSHVLNPLSKARDQTWILMDTSQICFHCAPTGIPITNSRICFFFFFFFFFFFRAAPVACGGSHARGRIRAVASGLLQSHSNARSEPHLRPTPQLMATLDP